METKKIDDKKINLIRWIVLVSAVVTLAVKVHWAFGLLLLFTPKKIS